MLALSHDFGADIYLCAIFGQFSKSITPSTVNKKHLIRNIVEIIRNLGNID